MKYQATWNNQLIAESDQTIEIEGNQYFPPHAVKKEFLQPSATHTTCPWKGEASYYTVTLGDQSNVDAAWFYPEPKAGATDVVGANFANYIAFWRGVSVTPAQD